MAVIVVVMFTTKHTRMRSTGAMTVGIAVGSATKQSRRTATDLATVGIVMVGGTKETRTAFANFSAIAIVVISGTKQTRATSNLLFSHNEIPPKLFVLFYKPHENEDWDVHDQIYNAHYIHYHTSFYRSWQ
jgi:hypothetical protein